MKRAVVLLSGGLDSATTLAIAKHDGYETFALSFEYGQRHRVEIDSAKLIALSLGVCEHRIAKIDLRVFGGSALTDAIDVPKSRSDAEIANQIPVTYVPARNTIFLSYALAWAEAIELTTFLSALMRGTTVDIPIAGLNLSNNSSDLRISGRELAFPATAFEFTHL